MDEKFINDIEKIRVHINFIRFLGLTIIIIIIMITFIYWFVWQRLVI